MTASLNTSANNLAPQAEAYAEAPLISAKSMPTPASSGVQAMVIPLICPVALAFAAPYWSP